jgi:hypothetical protein
MGTDSSIATGTLILSNPLIPGEPIPLLTPPTDGFVNPVQHNVALPALPLGTKITVYQSGNGSTIPSGYYTMVYGQVGTQDTQDAIASGSLMVRETTTAWDWKFTNVAGGAQVQNIGVYAISSMTNSYYGWFWCGGVAPDFLISGTTYGNTVVTVTAKTTLITDGTVAADTGVVGHAAYTTNHNTKVVLSILTNAMVGGGFGLSVVTDT